MPKTDTVHTTESTLTSHHSEGAPPQCPVETRLRAIVSMTKDPAGPTSNDGKAIIDLENGISRTQATSVAGALGQLLIAYAYADGSKDPFVDGCFRSAMAFLSKATGVRLADVGETFYQSPSWLDEDLAAA